MGAIVSFLKEMMPMWFLVFSGFLFAFGITYMTIPAIVRVARLKNLYAMPNSRTSHSNATPNLGGVALFLGYVISTLMIAGVYFSSELIYIISGIIILFYVGMKDDILIIDPKKKFAAQIIVAVIIAVFADMRLTGFPLIVNMGTLSYLLSICFTVFIILVIINGFNLIDGVDGLAAGVGILCSIFFGAWFWIIEDTAYSVLCFSLAGALTAFFLFNVFGKKNKIFMGDTGSLILGLSISIAAIHFLVPDKNADEKFILPSPALAFGILILPLFDTVRIFTIRIYQQKSPFVADHQHIHHRLLDLGFSHLQTTIILLLLNAFFIGFCILFQKINTFILLFVILSMATVLSYILLKLALRHISQKNMNEGIQKNNAVPGRMNVQIPQPEIEYSQN